MVNDIFNTSFGGCNRSTRISLYDVNALDISNCFFDKDNLVKGIIFDNDMFLKGSLLQQKASETIVQLTDKIWCVKKVSFL